MFEDLCRRFSETSIVSRAGLKIQPHPPEIRDVQQPLRFQRQTGHLV